uniref:Uncharacterized protein n=1 Tax=Spongospora subterranea TaxID=70186 RepID=A0A0H5RRJ0_9EUKA|eukprot:CRZ11319.1 hypothetical protein [Spongospora subterranea]
MTDSSEYIPASTSESSDSADAKDHAESLLKAKRLMGMAPHEIASYSQIQLYRDGKPEQVLGELPVLDEFMQLKQQSSTVRIDNMLQVSKKLASFNAEAAKKAKQEAENKQMSKQAKVFGIDDNDLEVYTAHEKVSKIFGDAPPKDAFPDGAKR